MRPRITIVECFYGVFAFNENNMVLASVLFPKKTEKIVAILERIQRMEAIEEALELVELLIKQGYTHFLFENDSLAKVAKEKLGIDVSIDRSSQAGLFLRNNLRHLAVKMKFVADKDEIDELLHTISVLMVKTKIKEALGNRDLIVSQVVFVIDDLDKTFNLLVNRLREWYGYHFPELSNQIGKSDTYVRLTASLGHRYNFTIENLIKFGLNVQSAEVISESKKTSMGVDFNQVDVDEIHRFSSLLLEITMVRDRIEQYLEILMRDIAPNIRELVGSKLGARLIATAGGLKNLAKKSSGSIQILGAEKALFRSLKTGSRPPKHGLIFQQKSVHQSPKKNRGKIARALACKLAISARLDAYGGSYHGDTLKQEFDKRVEEINSKLTRTKRKTKR